MLRPELQRPDPAARRAYEAIRAQQRRFILRPGHEDPTIERVVESCPEYEVVEKRAA